MARRVGGTQAEPGFYWNPAEWQIVTIEKREQPLPGDRTHRYVKVPAAAMLLLAPMLGLGFVIFLPLIGFAIVAREAWRRVTRRGDGRPASWPEERSTKAA